MFFDTVLCAGSQLIEVPTGFGHANDRHIEVAAFGHGLQRRKDLFKGEIAGCAKEDKSVRVGITHRHLLQAVCDLLADFSRCPPN